MHTYVDLRDNSGAISSYKVMFYYGNQDSSYMTIQYCKTKDEAIKLVNYLNGGSKSSIDVKTIRNILFNELQIKKSDLGKLLKNSIEDFAENYAKHQMNDQKFASIISNMLLRDYGAGATLKNNIADAIAKKLSHQIEVGIKKNK